jgi:hypothetical protein
MPGKAILTVALLLTTPLFACGGKRAQTVFDPARETYVAVTNNHWLDIAVYAVRAGTRFRLGTVRGLSEDSLPLRSSVVGSGDNIRLLVSPIGSRGGHLTDYLSIGGDRWIHFQVQNPLNLSSFTVWPHSP